MKKSIIYLLGLVAFVFTVNSCTDEYMAPGPEANHAYVTYSNDFFSNKIQVDELSSFGDLSSGVVSRTWTFPDNVTDIQGSEDDKTSTEQIVNATFNKPGIYEVLLQHVFAGNVWVDSIQLNSNKRDTTITINVLDYVKAQFSAVYLNEDGSEGEALVIEDGVKNRLDAGRSVRFKSSSAGSPDRFDWYFEKGDPEYSSQPTADSVIDVKYRLMDAFDVQLIAYRLRPEGSDTIYLKDLIEVVPSADPVTLDEAYETNGMVALSFSRAMADPAAELENFMLDVRQNGTGKPYATDIASVSLDASQSNIVLLTLKQEIYSSDIVKVSYSPGNLQTTDGAAVDSIDLEPVLFTLSDMLPVELNGGFENEGEGWLTEDVTAGVPDLGSATFTKELKHSGEYSLLMENPTGEGAMCAVKFYTKDADANVVVPFTLQKGLEYMVTFWMYIESADLSHENDFGIWYPEDFGTDCRVRLDYGSSSASTVLEWEANKWIKVQRRYKAGDSDQRWVMIRALNRYAGNEATTNQKIYIDDMEMGLINQRP